MTTFRYGGYFGVMPASLDPGSYYHVYNRAVGGEDLFREPRN